MANILDVLKNPSALNDLLSYNPALKAGELQYKNLQQIQPILQQQLQRAIGTQPYGGAYQAEFDPTRMAGIQDQLQQGQQQANLANTLGGTATGLQGGLGTSQNVLGQLAQGQIQQGVNQNILQQGTANPYLDASIQAQQRGLQRNFQEQVNPALSAAARRGGLTGLGAAALQADAGQRLSEDLSDIEAKNRSAAYQAAYQAAVGAGANEFQARQSAANTLGSQAQAGAQLVPTAQKALLAPGATQEAAGVQFQNQRQAEIDAERQRIQDQRNYGFDVLGQYGKAAGILGPTQAAPNVTQLTNLGEIAKALTGGTSLQSQAINKAIQAIGGGAGAVAGAAGKGVQDILKSIFGGGGGAGGTTGGDAENQDGGFYGGGGNGTGTTGEGAGYDAPIGGYEGPAPDPGYDAPIGGYDPGYQDGEWNLPPPIVEPQPFYGDPVGGWESSVVDPYDVDNNYTFDNFWD